MSAHDNRPWHKWYCTATWQKLRKAQLRREPLCRDCQAIGRIEPATHVDHIKAHRGDWSLFIDKRNHQSMCASCHSRKTVYLDGGYGRARNEKQQARGCDVNGLPLDPDHPWRNEPMGGCQKAGANLRLTICPPSRDIPQIKKRG